MISIFADERQHSDNAEERAEARTAISHELAEIQRAEDKFLADLYGGKYELAEIQRADDKFTAIFTKKKTDSEEEPATDQMQ